MRTADSDCHSSYTFIDLIIKAAIQSSPHTTPLSKFPGTNEALRNTLETQKFKLAIPLDFDFELCRPASQYIVQEDNNVDSDDDRGSEMLRIRSDSPSPTQQMVWDLSFVLHFIFRLVS